MKLKLCLAAAFAVLSISVGTASAADCSATPAVSQAVIRMVNAEREQRGQAPVRLSAELNKVAARHACDMARRGYFGHRSPEGTSLKGRVYSSGYKACQAAENLVRGVVTPQQANAAWMGSHGHRSNILWRGVEEAGIGLSGQGANMKWVLVLARAC